MRTLALAALFMTFVSCAPALQHQPPDVVPQVDLARYAGRWYEIAGIPDPSRKGCTDAQTEYRLRGDGRLDIVDSCTRNGKVETEKGTAWAPDPKETAKLKASFSWFSRSDYWVVELGVGYEYAVVSSPDMQSLRILSRTPQMVNAQYRGIIRRLQQRGFDLSRLERMEQGNRKD